MENNGVIWKSNCVIKRHGGAPLLRITLRYPSGGVFGDCYAEAARLCAEWAGNSLFPLLCREFDSSDDPRRRFLPPWRYSFEVTARPQQENLLALLRVSLSRGGRERASRTAAALFSPDGKILHKKAEKT